MSYKVIPDQTGNSGKYLKTDGDSLLWDTPAGGGLSDGDKGDITVTSSGTVWTIDSQNLQDIKTFSLSGNALKVLRVNNGETAIELATVTSGSGLEQYQVRRMMRR